MALSTTALPTTRERVPASTSSEINSRIEEEIRLRVRYYAEHRDEIAIRLRELESEWDIERAIELNASMIGLYGLVRGLFGTRAWLAVPALVSGFLMQHALNGWCPPVPLLRRLGFRTAHEIERERHALKALRGDYEGLNLAPDAGRAAFIAAGP